MQNSTENKISVVRNIKRQINILNGIVLLIICALLFLVVRFLYIVLNYIPISSVVGILALVAILIATGVYVASIASRNAIKTIEEYSNKLNALLTSTRNIREIIHTDMLLNNIMENSLKMTNADAGSLLLTEGENLVFKIAKGVESNKLSGISIPKSHGIVGWVVDNGHTLRIDNVKDDSRFDPAVDNITGYNTKSILCAPLRLSSGIIGAIELVNKKNGVFTPDDEELILYFADQAATAINMAKFYEGQKNYEIHLTDVLLTAMDTHIHEKSGHSKRVAKYSLLIARAINMSEDEKKKLYRACMLHDIGFLKIKLQDVMSPEEYRAHPEIAFEMLRPITFYADIAPFILHHHERYDGNGYPARLKGEAIPLESRIIAIAEAFDAMVSKDSYKYVGKSFSGVPAQVYGFRSAIEELRNNAGTQFDPELVDIFVSNISESFLEEM